MQSINARAFILGRKPVSVDATVASVMGFHPETIRHLVDAMKCDLGSLHPTVLGEDVESMLVKFDRPSALRSTAIVE